MEKSGIHERQKKADRGGIVTLRDPRNNWLHWHPLHLQRHRLERLCTLRRYYEIIAGTGFACALIGPLIGLFVTHTWTGFVVPIIVGIPIWLVAEFLVPQYWPETCSVCGRPLTLFQRRGWQEVCKSAGWHGLHWVDYSIHFGVDRNLVHRDCSRLAPYSCSSLEPHLHKDALWAAAVLSQTPQAEVLP